MKRAQRVLIVDPSAESREVVRTVLERRGVDVVEADNTRVGARLVRQCAPDLVVVDGDLDAEEMDAETEASSETLLVGDAPERVPRVVLGKMRHAGAGDRLLAKPYQYATLIRTIEELLGTASEAQRPAA